MARFCHQLAPAQAAGVDLFLLADRTELDGERVLPAKLPDTRCTTYRRLSDQEVKKQIGQIQRGKFKVYIGAAPGVGKTYMMLREGNDLLRKGIDVRIGLLETHNRAETMEQIGQLLVIPRDRRTYQSSVGGDGYGGYSSPLSGSSVGG